MRSRSDAPPLPLDAVRSAALARAIKTALDDPSGLRNETLTLRSRVQAEFSADAMTDGVLAAYDEALQARRG